MEITEQNPTVEDISNLNNASMEVTHQNLSEEAPSVPEKTDFTEPSATTDPPPFCLHETIKVCLKPSVTALLKAFSHGSARGRPEICRTVLNFNAKEMALLAYNQALKLFKPEHTMIFSFWQVKPVVHAFQLIEKGPFEELSGDGESATCKGI